jgi:tetratricopeptide (TPR) repeat protein
MTASAPSFVTSAPAPSNDSVRRVGPATARRVEGLHVLTLKGTFREMGRQHGALLAAEVADGPVPYFKTVVQKNLRSSPIGAAAPFAWAAVEKLVGGRIARELPSYAVETIRGIAEGAGVPYDEMLAGCTMPDAFLWAASQVMKLKGPGPAVAHRISLGLGCTSAVAWGSATRDGKLLHGRNFDYHGVSSWPKHQAVLFHEPAEGLRYVSVAAAGVGLGGVTAMNEAGLSLTVHQHMFTDRARLGGVPIGVLGDRVMREAKSLDDAERILSSTRPNGCWTYLVTDGPRREVLCHEENPDRHASIRKSASTGDDTFGYANIYLDEELGSTEVNLYGSYWRHNQGRHRRANALLAEGRGQLDAEGIARILGHAGDPACRVRDSIAMVMTVASVVFKPEDGVVWVGTGEAPTSRGKLVPFSLGKQGHAPEHGALELRGRDSTRDRAFEHFRRAYVAYVDGQDLAAALAEARLAAELSPEDALFHALTGLFAIEAGDGDTALARFQRCIELGHPDVERVAAFHLWKARALDLLGRRREALVSYRWALGHVADAPVHAAARKGLRSPFTRERARRVHVDVAFCDVVSP